MSIGKIRMLHRTVPALPLKHCHLWLHKLSTFFILNLMTIFQHGHGDYVSGLGCEPAYMNSSMLINNQLVKNPFEGRQGPIL